MSRKILKFNGKKMAQPFWLTSTNSTYSGLGEHIPHLSSGIDAGIKLRPDNKDLELLGPDFKDPWETYFAPAPDKPIMFLGLISAYVAYRGNQGGSLMTHGRSAQKRYEHNR